MHKPATAVDDSLVSRVRANEEIIYQYDSHHGENTNPGSCQHSRHSVISSPSYDGRDNNESGFRLLETNKLEHYAQQSDLFPEAGAFGYSYPVTDFSKYKRTGKLGEYFPRIPNCDKEKLLRESWSSIKRSDAVGMLTDLLLADKPGSATVYRHADTQRQLAKEIAQVIDKYPHELVLDVVTKLRVIPESLFGVMANASKRSHAYAQEEAHEARKMLGTLLPANVLGAVVEALQ